MRLKADFGAAVDDSLGWEAMTFRLNTWYSSQPPASVSIVAVYFAFGGVLMLVGTALQVFFVVRGGATAEEVGPGPLFTATLGGALGGLWLAAGILLWNRRRVGALLALGSLVLEIFQWVVWRVPTMTDVLFFVGVLALIAVSWRSLETADGS